MRQNFKNFTFIRRKALLIFSILLLFANIPPVRAEEKAIQQGLSTKEWLECVAKVGDEFYGPIKACLEKNRYRYPMCEKITNEQNEASDKERARRCILAQQEDSPSTNPTEQSAQDQSSDNNTSAIPNYTKALIEKPPRESDFQKIPKTDFKKVNPVSTASATPKLATESANITGSTFIGKVGEEGKILIDLPNGETVTLTDDQTALEGEISGWKLLKGGDKPLSSRPLQVSIYEKDCHSEILEANPTRRASDWGGNNVITKIVGDCTYSNSGDPIRILVDTGEVNFKTSSGTRILAKDSDFGISFETTSGQSIVEIYNGSITITNRTGNSKTISTIYGSEIKQIEIDNNGVMSEKIAIPLSQWQAFFASKQEEKDEPRGNTLPIAGALAVLGLGGIAFFLYRTGKLLPLYRISSQKITQILQKISKEKRTD